MPKIATLFILTGRVRQAKSQTDKHGGLTWLVVRFEMASAVVEAQHLDTVKAFGNNKHLITNRIKAVYLLIRRLGHFATCRKRFGNTSCS